MNKGKTIFSQIMSLIPERDFKACVDRYKGNYRSRNFSCKDQFLVKKGSGDRFLIRLCLKDINTPGRARIHQVSSRNTSLRLQG